jgi:hypothetical protein
MDQHPEVFFAQFGPRPAFPQDAPLSPFAPGIVPHPHSLPAASEPAPEAQAAPQAAQDEAAAAAAAQAQAEQEAAAAIAAAQAAPQPIEYSNAGADSFRALGVSMDDADRHEMAFIPSSMFMVESAYASQPVI